MIIFIIFSSYRDVFIFALLALLLEQWSNFDGVLL